MKLKNGILTNIVLLTLIILLASCSDVQRSASMAFDNANSAIKTGEKKAWTTPPPKGSTHTAQKEEQEENS